MAAPFDFAGTFTEAGNALGNIETRNRQRAAYNALRSAYGDAAGDPDTAAKLEEIQQRKALLPGQVVQQGATLAGTQAQTAAAQAGTAETQQKTQLQGAQAQREGQSRALSLLQDSVDPATNSVSPETYDKVVRQNAAVLGIDPSHVDALGQQLAQPGGAQHLETIRRSLLGPTQVTGAPIAGRDAQGNTVLLERDKYGNIVQSAAPGVTTVSQQNADRATAALDERKAQDEFLRKKGWSQVQIQAFRASTAANNSAFGAGDASLPATGGAPVAPAGAPAAAPSPKGPAIPAALASMPMKGKQLVTSQAQQIAGAKVNLDNANAIADSMVSQITPYTTGAGALRTHLPAGTAVDLQRNAETLRAQAAQAVLSGAKNAQGSTGLGRILQAEYKNFTNMYGNLEQDQNMKQYAYHLDLLKKSLNKMYQIQHDGFTTNYKVSPEAWLSQGSPEPQAAAPAAAAPANDPLGLR